MFENASSKVWAKLRDFEFFLREKDLEYSYIIFNLCPIVSFIHCRCTRTQVDLFKSFPASTCDQRQYSREQTMQALRSKNGAN